MSERPTIASSPGTAPSTGSWTTRMLLDWMAGAFKAKGLDEPRLCAEMLLGHVLECERLRLYMDADRRATDAERERLRALVARALKHEPMQYLIGRWPFFGIELKTDRRGLIPRPSTETIVESVLQWRRAVEGPRRSPVMRITDFEQPEVEGSPPQAASSSAPAPAEPAPSPPELRIADICCGGGAIAIALARNLPHARVIATDLSEEALALAAENMAEQGLGDRIELRRGDLLAPLAGEAPFDIIVSNPPYIPDDEWSEVEANVRDFEPEMALRGGPDGMAMVRPIIAGAGALLAVGGRMLVEVAASRTDEARDLAARAGLVEARILDDIDGLPRVIVGERRA